MLTQPKHIAIDVQVHGEEISGVASDGIGRPTPFLGWLGLAIGALNLLLIVYEGLLIITLRAGR